MFRIIRRVFRCNRFEWGHLDEDAYQAEWQRLQARRLELLAAQEVKPQARLRLVGLVDAWDRADQIGRRELLASLFEESTAARGAPDPVPAFAGFSPNLAGWPFLGNP